MEFAHRRDGDDVRGQAGCAHPSTHVEAVQIGQGHIHQDQVDGHAGGHGRGQGAQGGMAVADSTGVREAGQATEVGRVRLGGDGLVLDDENPDVPVKHMIRPPSPRGWRRPPQRIARSAAGE